MDTHVLPRPEDFSHRCVTEGPQDTLRLGRELSGLLSGGRVILLYGSLGAGKTCLVQGICNGLGVEMEVVSPTFTLVNTYDGRLKVHHLDFYRVDPGHDLNDIGVPDLLDEVWDEQAVLLVEWPGPLLTELGPDTPRTELLVETGTTPRQRIWHLRQIPAVETAWADLFGDGNGGRTC